jgi:hypothetical protein
MPPLLRKTPKDNTMTYGAGYALVTVLFIWLEFNNLPLTTPFDILTEGVCSFILLNANLVLLILSLDALGQTMLPDNHDKGTNRTYIGAVMSMHVTVNIVVFTHWVDNKTLPFRVFWIQILALPGACITTKFFGNMINGKEQWFWRMGMYRLVNLMLWLDLQNIPDAEEEIPELGYNPFPLVVWMFSFGLLVLLDAFYLIESIVHNFEFREAENRKAGTLIVLGTFMGVLLVIGVMIPLELKFHVFKDRYWVYQTLVAELGALPGARLVGYSKWFAKVYEYGQPSLSGYSKINGGESQV